MPNKYSWLCDNTDTYVIYSCMILPYLTGIASLKEHQEVKHNVLSFFIINKTIEFYFLHIAQTSQFLGHSL